MTTRRIIGAVVLLAIGLGLGLGLAIALDDDDGDGGRDDALPVETTTTEAQRPDPDVNPEAAELYDAVIAFSERTIYAKYRVEVAARPESTTTIEVWQKDGLLRQDATSDGADAAQGKLELLDLGDRVVLCQQPPGGKFSCGLVSEEQATTFGQLRTGLLADLAEQEVEVRDDTSDVGPLRCFVVKVAAASELCITDDGILARITGPQGTFELVDHSDEVDDSVFTPPAEPGATAPS